MILKKRKKFKIFNCLINPEKIDLFNKIFKIDELRYFIKVIKKINQRFFCKDDLICLKKKLVVMREI